MAYLGQTFYAKDLPNEKDTNSQPYFSDKDQIKSLLLNNLLRNLMFLYPNGKKDGNAFKIGSIAGEAGQSLTITLSGRYAGKGKDFATGETFDIFTLFAYYYNLDTQTQFNELLGRLREYLGLAQTNNKPLSQAEIASIKERQEQARLKQIEAEKQQAKIERQEQDKARKIALDIWNKAQIINDTLAQVYLQARGLNIAYYSNVLRYGKCYHWELKTNLPCLIALVKNTQSGQPTGIERHYLPPEPQATAEDYKQWFTDQGVERRKNLGRKNQCVIKLNDSYKDKLVLCEGLIDALTLYFCGRELGILGKEIPNIYAFLGASNLANIIIPDRYKEIYLLADNDRAGMKSIELLQNNSSLKGRTDVKIEIFKTNSHKDLNELWLSKLKEKPERGKTSELNNID
jgi:hypothetical protein